VHYLIHRGRHVVETRVRRDKRYKKSHRLPLLFPTLLFVRCSSIDFINFYWLLLVLTS
jgi:hypothetical protein